MICLNTWQWRSWSNEPFFEKFQNAIFISYISFASWSFWWFRNLSFDFFILTFFIDMLHISGRPVCLYRNRKGRDGGPISAGSTTRAARTVHVQKSESKPQDQAAARTCIQDQENCIEVKVPTSVLPLLFVDFFSLSFWLFLRILTYSIGLKPLRLAAC